MHLIFISAARKYFFFFRYFFHSDPSKVFPSRGTNIKWTTTGIDRLGGLYLPTILQACSKYGSTYIYTFSPFVRFEDYFQSGHSDKRVSFYPAFIDRLTFNLILVCNRKTILRRNILSYRNETHLYRATRENKSFFLLDIYTIPFTRRLYKFEHNR